MLFPERSPIAASVSNEMALAATPNQFSKSLRQWIKQQEHLGPKLGDFRYVSDNTEPQETAQPDSSEIGFATILYEACNARLKDFVDILDDSKNSNLEYTPRDHRSFQRVAAKLRLFGGSFEYGKLESCLDDEEVFHIVLGFLLAIAITLNSGMLSDW